MTKSRLARLDGRPDQSAGGRRIGFLVVAFVSREIVWRPLAIVVGGTVVFLTVRMMVRGDFFFVADPPPWAGWDCVPGWTVLGAILMYVGVRQKRKAPKN
jgi:hypothetical protein